VPEKKNSSINEGNKAKPCGKFCRVDEKSAEKDKIGSNDKERETIDANDRDELPERRERDCKANWVKGEACKVKEATPFKKGPEAGERKDCIEGAQIFPLDKETE